MWTVSAAGQGPGDMVLIASADHDWRFPRANSPCARAASHLHLGRERPLRGMGPFGFSITRHPSGGEPSMWTHLSLRPPWL